jgi:hypothetical protein
MMDDTLKWRVGDEIKDAACMFDQRSSPE